MRPRRRIAGLFPTVAIVDAFVCAVSVVLILVITSAPAARNADTRPQADVTVRCLPPGDRAVLVAPQATVPARPMALDQVLASLPADRAGERLSLRLLIEATPDLVRCAVILRGMAGEWNRQRDANRPGDLGPVLVVDIAYVPAAPEPSE